MAQKNRQPAESLSGVPQPGFVGYKVAPIIAKRAPNSQDTGFPLGQDWVDKIGGNIYGLAKVAAGSATWNLSASVAGTVDTLTGDSGGAISPAASNINLLGTASQITTTGAGSTITFSLPAAMIVPGSLATTTSLAVGTSATIGTTLGVTGAVTLTASLSVGTTLGVTGASTLAALTQVGTANINATGAAVTTIGSTTGAAGTVQRVGTGNYSLDGAATSTYTFAPSTTSGVINFGGTGANTGTATIFGGTGAQTINIANSTGGKILAIASGAGANAVTIGSTNTTSATTIQAGSGLINLNGASVALNTAGTQLKIKGGAATDFVGSATLVAGVATVLNTNILPGDTILIDRRAINLSTAYGVFITNVTGATSFTITSCKADTTTETGDVSTVMYVIIRQI